MLYPRVADCDETVYRLLKRWAQGDAAAVDAERGRLSSSAAHAASAVLGEPGRRRFGAAAHGRTAPTWWRWRQRVDAALRHGAARVRQPAAFVLRFAGTDAAARSAAVAWSAWFGRYHSLEVALFEPRGVSGVVAGLRESRRIAVLADVSGAAPGGPPALEPTVAVGDVEALVRIRRAHA